jgi:thioesterase domain-containing protein
MACGLVGAGEEVELLLLLDTMAPEAGRWRARAASRDRVLRRDSVADRVRGQAGIIRWAVEDTISLALGERRVGGRPVGFVDRFDRAGASRLIRGYRPPRLEAPVTVFHTAVSRTAMGGPDLGWGRHVGGEVTTRELPGDHMSIFSEPQVRALGWAISGELGRARPQE